jgi:hypothetical protein
MDDRCTNCLDAPATTTYDGERMCEDCADLRAELAAHNEAEQMERDRLNAEDDE